MNLVPRRIEDFPIPFQSFFSRWFPTWSRSRDENDDFWAPFRWGFNSPAIDVEETEKEIVVRAEIPGLEKDEFTLEIGKDALFLRGEKKRENETKDRNYYRKECSYGSFSHTIPLPVEVLTDKAEAEYKNGVLRVRLPKTEKSQTQKIAVQIK